MHPILYQFEGDGSFAIATYPVMQALGALVLLVLGGLTLRSQVSLGRGLLLIGLFIATMYLGSRLGYRILSTLGEEQGGATGMWLPGGILLALPTLLLVGRWLRADPWWLVDHLAPSVYLSAGIARLGCFFQGCCYGERTEGWWGLRFPKYSPAHLGQMNHDPLGFLSPPAPVHPTQLMDVALCWLLALVSLALLTGGVVRKPGLVALGCGTLFTLGRAFIGTLRASDPKLPTWANDAPYLPLSIALVLLIAAVIRWRHTSESLAAPASIECKDPA